MPSQVGFRRVVAVLEHGPSETTSNEAELLFTESDWQQTQSLLNLARPDETATNVTLSAAKGPPKSEEDASLHSA